MFVVLRSPLPIGQEEESCFNELPGNPTGIMGGSYTLTDSEFLHTSEATHLMMQPSSTPRDWKASLFTQKEHLSTFMTKSFSVKDGDNLLIMLTG